MDRSELWSLFVTALAVVVGVSMVGTSPVAAVCLVLYGSLVGLRTFFEPVREIAEENRREFSIVQILLLLVALFDVFF